MAPCLAYSMLKYSVSPRRDATFQHFMLFYFGETPLLKTSVSPKPYTCVQVYACFAMAKQHFQHAHSKWHWLLAYQKPLMQPQRKLNKNEKPRFQDQWVTKTLEKTKANKKTKISGPMDSQHHRENQNTQDFRTNGVAKTSENTKHN